jgi:predicted aconitase with swiveling domain
MEYYGGIKQKIKSIAGTDRPGLFFVAQVKTVDKNAGTCSVVIDELPLSDVRLRAVVNSESEQILIIPAVGSYVLIADISEGERRSLAIISFSEIESINITVGGENLKNVLSDFIDEVTKIIVIQGTGPNIPALTNIKQRLCKILN